MRKLVASAVLLLTALAIFWPVPEAELALGPAVSLRVEARDGTLLRELPSLNEGYAAPAHLDALPAHVVSAFVRAEDRRFFKHPGVDPLALGRALIADVRQRRFAQGGSTLAMQLARMLRPHRRTLAGKLSEAWFALRLTATLGRRGVLEQYLTRIPLGNDVRGVEAAARLYFDRPARALNPAQAALLASLPRSPRALNPLRKSVSAYVFDGMDLAREKLQRAFEAPQFVAWIAAQKPAGPVVRTPLDLGLQRALERAAREQVALLADRNVTSAAIVVLDNATGDVLAWVGSPDWFDEEHGGRLDGVRIRRQPGSTLKPFAYGAAMERGLVTPATLLSDIESHFGEYIPKNYDRRTHGPVRARVALASSYNVPAVHVADMLGPQLLLGTLHKAGFTSLTKPADFYGLGLVLGDGEVTLYELAKAYRALATGRLFTPQTTALLADILSDPAARAPAFGLDNVLRFSYPVAAKTGTSRAFTDNWTVGFTHERTVAVWVGNMSGETMHHVSGITGAGPLFHKAMELAMAGVEKPAPLTETKLEERDVCALSGELAGPSCPVAHEKFARGTAPRTQCRMHTPRGLDLGPRFDDWAAREGIRTEPVGAYAGRAALQFPRDGDEFLRSRDLPDGFQTIPVRAEAPRGAALELQLDDGPREELHAPFSTRIPAAAGRHHLRLFRKGAPDADASLAFVVRG